MVPFFLLPAAGLVPGATIIRKRSLGVVRPLRNATQVYDERLGDLGETI